MLQPRSGASVGWASDTQAPAVLWRTMSQIPPLCNQDSQSQCSVHRLPQCPSPPVRLKAVKHSRSQYGSPAGAEYEMKR